MVNFLKTTIACGGQYLAPAVVFEGVLDGRNAQYENDWNHGHFLAESAHSRNPVKQHNKEEVEVCEAVKLLEQILGYERKWCVL